MKKCNKMPKDVHCPIVNKKIDIWDCYFTACVFEGEAPVSELADGIQDSTEHCEACRACPNHGIFWA